MISIEVILIILIVHFIGDFVFQLRSDAHAKSSNNLALLRHVGMYSVPLLIIGPLYAALNGILHFMTDYVTSRLSKSFWGKGKEKSFWTIIGLDQTLHMIALFGTYVLIFGLSAA